MPLVKEINRLLFAILIAFSAVAVTAAYWAVIGPDTIYQRDDNPRRVAAEAAIQRGQIVDRSRIPLADSSPNDQGQMTRKYHYQETSSFLGYSSLRFGVGGAEAAYDSILRGDNVQPDLGNYLLATLLHRPQVGTDIQITLDLGIQRAMADAMAGQTGAAVILAVPNGDILGLVSLPTYDPNTLDDHWDTLAESPDKPFFNRALQGSYQPGGTLQTPLLAAALVAKQAVTQNYLNGTAPIHLDDGTLVSCAVQLPFEELSLRDAYAFACPTPFVALAEQLGSQTIAQTLATFHFDNPLVVADYPLEVQGSQAINIDDDSLIENALGQADLTVSPLQMATMVAAIINDGNAPRPYTLVSTHTPGEDTWIPSQVTRPTIPVATEETARQLQDLMRDAVANGAALNAARPGIDIGGHTALGYAGGNSQAWFIGFATLNRTNAIALAVVLENSDDPGLAADIGGTILVAAREALIAVPEPVR